MRTRLKISIFRTALVVTLVYILYDTRLISYLAQRINKSMNFETAKEFFSIDLSDEFESSKDLMPPFDVMEALKRDGYSPRCVSVTSMTRTEWDILMLERYNLPKHKETIAVIEGNHSDSLRKVNEMQPVLKVPNVVHYVFLGSDLTFTFIDYLSYRSVDRFIRPDQIFVHGDHTPSGKWWNRTINEVQNIYHVKRMYSNKAPNGQPYRYPAHISDYMRTETLLRYGGIYLDADVLVVKSFNQLRQFSFVIGRETSGGLCNGIMVAERGAPFLRLLLEEYHSYLGSKEKWTDRSVKNTNKLALIYPHLVHVEEKTLNRPNWIEVAQIYDGRYNWKQNYAVHLWIRVWPKEKRPNGVEDIVTKNTTFAELARLAIFGSHEISKQFGQ